jgi:GH43 family beta-xylosidase
MASQARDPMILQGRNQIHMYWLQNVPEYTRLARRKAWKTLSRRAALSRWVGKENQVAEGHRRQVKQP